MELLRIRNVGDKPLVLRHDGKGHITIDPFSERIVLEEYAHLSFGDPRMIDSGKNKERSEAFNAIRTLWGFYPGVEGMTEAAWEDTYKPRYECYDMDGNRVAMILDDPDGVMNARLTATPTTEQSDRIEQSQMAAVMARQQAQIDQLTAALSALGLNPAQLGQQQTPAAPVFDPAAFGQAAVDQAAAARAAAQVPGAQVSAPSSPWPPIPPDDPAPGLVAPSIPPFDPHNPGAGNAEIPAADGTSQAERNATEIPNPPADEAPVTADTPRTTRSGPVGGLGIIGGTPG